MILKPKGCEDILGKESIKREFINNVIKDLMRVYNYGYIKTPVFEYKELFHRSVGEGTDIVTKETYDFTDRGGRELTLRPEGTAGVVRSFIENKMFANPVQPVKLYYNDSMYRYERPQSGRQREFYQFGIETLGSDNEIIDAEVISIGAVFFKLLNLDVVVKINSLGDTKTRENYEEALRNYLKPLINDLCPDCQRRYKENILRILDCKYDQNSKILKEVPHLKDYLSKEAKERYEKVKHFLDLLEVEYVEDDNLVRGFDYYNHVVFEYHLKNKESLALGGGGRYNHLVEDLGGPLTPACGMAIGLERVSSLLDEIEDEGIDVYVMAISMIEKEYALNLVQYLRNLGFTVSMDYLDKNLKNQFKQADRLRSKYLLILNEEDLKNDQVNIKDNKTKKEEKVDRDYIVYYLEEHIKGE